MKRTGNILLIAGCILAPSVLYAQEFPAELPARFQPVPWELVLNAPKPYSLQWLREEMDPNLQEVREIRSLLTMRTRAQASLIGIEKSRYQRDLKKEVGAWRMHIGRTGVNNWSPFLDRKLDARTLRFPVPRNSRADKRPEKVKALEKMRREHRQKK